MMLYMKLRSNIRIKDDIDLAKRELSTMFDEVSSIASGKYFEKAGIPAGNTRHTSPVGFTCKTAKQPIDNVLRSINFVQEVWIKKDDPILDNYKYRSHGYANGKHVMFVPLMASSELLEKTYNGRLSEENHENLNRYLAGEKVAMSKLYHRAVNLQSSSTQHVHGLHKYKAKFFPRFVRSLIVTHIEDVPSNLHNEKTILDPFVGSGTALVEASILGFRSYGLDIDKLSCEISKAKLAILGFEYKETLEYIREIETSLQRFSRHVSSKETYLYRFPSIIGKKFQRWNATDEQAQYEKEISSILDFLSTIRNTKLKTLLSICISDALCKKFNIRMMGTGSGRFALEISKTELTSLVNTNFRNLMKILFSTASLKKRSGIQPAHSEVHHGNAKKMPFPDNQMSLVVTSPPYLPASSGRENYLVGKAISMTALDLVKEKELEAIDLNSVGSIRALKGNDDGSLPKAVYHLINWLENDPLRNIKAKPVLNYYLDLKQSLRETIRVLANGGAAIYIIGKTSAFYNAKTRDILYQVKCDDIFSELAEDIGFEIVEKTDIELDKKNKNARPRSLDSYFESAFVIRKSI